MQVPFASSSESKASRMNSFYFRVRVNVQEGPLTITSTSCSGPHNPRITEFDRTHRVFPTGSSFIVECRMGPQTIQGSRGHHDQVNWGVFTEELGQIIQLSTVVTY